MLFFIIDLPFSKLENYFEIEKHLKGNSILRGDNPECVPTKEVNTILVLAIPGKYTVLAIKPILILLQNIPKKYQVVPAYFGCIGLYRRFGQYNNKKKNNLLNLIYLLIYLS